MTPPRRMFHIFYCGSRRTAGDWEVTIVDFVVLLAQDAKKVRDAANRAKGLWGIRLRCRNWGLTPAIIL